MIGKLKSAVKVTAQKKRQRSPKSSHDKKLGKKNKKKKKKEEAGAAPKKIPEIIVEDAQPKPHSIKKRGPKVLVKVAESQTFASVLRKIKMDLRLEACNATVVEAVKTAKGDVLLKLKKDSDTQKMPTSLDQIIAGIGKVAESNEPKVTIKIRDIDGFAEKVEVESAVERILGRKTEVTLFRPNSRQQRTAIVVVPEPDAAKLE